MDIRLKEVLCNLKNYDFDILGSYKLDKNEAQKLIDVLEDIEKGGWVSCSEKMPEQEGEYLVCFDDGFIATTSYIDGDWELWAYAGEPTAWQPLPQAFEESEGKE